MSARRRALRRQAARDADVQSVTSTSAKIAAGCVACGKDIGVVVGMADGRREARPR